MRIRVLQKPTTPSIDGIRLDAFQPGFVYDVGTTLSMLFLAEEWAEPVPVEQPALVIPLKELDADAAHHSVDSYRQTNLPVSRRAFAADRTRTTERRQFKEKQAM